MCGESNRYMRYRYVRPQMVILLSKHPLANFLDSSNCIYGSNIFALVLKFAFFASSIQKKIIKIYIYLKLHIAVTRGFVHISNNAIVLRNITFCLYYSTKSMRTWFHTNLKYRAYILNRIHNGRCFAIKSVCLFLALVQVKMVFIYKNTIQPLTPNVFM